LEAKNLRYGFKVKKITVICDAAIGILSNENIATECAKDCGPHIFARFYYFFLTFYMCYQ